MRIPVPAALLLAVLPALTGCWHWFVDREEELTYLTALSAWLDCVECRDGELAAVRDLGDAMVPTLAVILEKGASPARESVAQAQARRTYQLLYGDGESPPVTQAVYVESAVNALHLRHRARAAWGLIAIDSPASTMALVSAYLDTDDELLRETILLGFEGHTGRDLPLP